MIFTVAEECARLGLRAGAIVFRNVGIAPSSLAQRAEISDEASIIRSRFSSPSEIRADPYVSSFQEIVRQVGGHPKTDRSSLERLMTFALKRGDLPAINNLVDSYNLVSVRTFCSLGAHDLDRIKLPVSLRILTGWETFVPLGTDMPVRVDRGEFGYVDASNSLLCRLDVLQAEFSKVTDATKNVLLIVEGTTAHKHIVLRKTFNDVIQLVTRYCGGAGEIAYFPE